MCKAVAHFIKDLSLLPYCQLVPVSCVCFFNATHYPNLHVQAILKYCGFVGGELQCKAGGMLLSDSTANITLAVRRGKAIKWADFDVEDG